MTLFIPKGKVTEPIIWYLLVSLLSIYSYNAIFRTHKLLLHKMCQIQYTCCLFKMIHSKKLTKRNINIGSIIQFVMNN